MNTLNKQGKLKGDIMSFYGENNELYIGSYGSLNEDKVFWINVTENNWIIKGTRIAYEGAEYSQRRFNVKILLECNGIKLPKNLYENIFLKTIKRYSTCSKSNDFFECDISKNAMNDFPRFALWFYSNVIVLHPLSYITNISGNRYRLNIRQSKEDSIILGADALNRVHVVLDNEKKRIGFINYDEDNTERLYESFSNALLITSIVILSTSIISALGYYFLSLKQIISF